MMFSGGSFSRRLNVWIDTPHLGSRLLGAEHPLDTRPGLVTPALPGRDLLLELRLAVDPSEFCISGPVLDEGGGESALRPSSEDVLDQLGCIYRVVLRRLHLQ